MSDDARIKQLESELDAVTRRLGLAMATIERLERKLSCPDDHEQAMFLHQFEATRADALRNGAD